LPKKLRFIGRILTETAPVLFFKSNGFELSKIKPIPST